MTQAPPATIEYLLDGGRLTLESLDAAHGRRIRVAVADSVWRRIEASAHAVRRIASSAAAALHVQLRDFFAAVAYAIGLSRGYDIG